MKDKYLTIGEISKIKKISIKSLRYYEQIGILVPVKINPDNGYRYYSQEQLLTIDMIKFLSAMDIPLKAWNHYIDSDCLTSPVEFKPYPTELQFYYSVEV